MHFSKIISIQLNSNRPAQLVAYFDNVEETADNPQEVEVLVNIDQGDDDMKNLLDSEITKRKFTLKYIQSPRPDSFYDLWKPINKLLEITDQGAYFLLNISDEMFFSHKGWDSTLKKYVGLFPDHIFRLRASRNKYRNYYDRWECNFAQDSIPFTTRKWLNIVGDWNPCFGPDSFQQLISFYLAKDGAFSYEQIIRDIPITDIEFLGDIPTLGLQSDKHWSFRRDSVKALLICQSYEMQLEARRRAMLLKASILVHEKLLQNPKLVENKKKKFIQIYTQNQVHATLSYKLNWFKITLENQWRKLFFFYYFGHGFNIKIKPFQSVLYYLMIKYKLAFNTVNFFLRFLKIKAIKKEV